MKRAQWVRWAPAVVAMGLSILWIVRARDENGGVASVLGLLGVAFLLSCVEAARRRTEAARRDLVADSRAARAEAAAALRLLDDSLATISHELRGPLSAVLGWVDRLRFGKLDERGTARALETIDRSAKAQAHLIAELLDASRIIADKVRLDVRPVELATIVAEAVEFIQPEADAKGVRVELDVGTTSGALSGDPASLHRVMANLLSNALKFTSSGGRIAVKMVCGEGDATVTVGDTGKGIRPDFLPHVFDRFRQANGDDPHAGGLGLGLTIVRHLVALHRGTVSAASDGEGRGARFTVTLPLAAESGCEDQAAEVLHVGANGAASGGAYATYQRLR